MTVSEILSRIPQWIRTGIPKNVKSSNVRTLLTWIAIRLDIQEVGRLKIVKVSGNTATEQEVGDRVSGVVEDTPISNATYLGGNINLLASYYINESSGGSSIINSNIQGNLKPGDSLGKYKGSFVIPSNGWTFQQLLEDVAMDYISPVFSSFNVVPQPVIVEVGTELSGNKTFTWGINQNSGIVPTIDIYDNTDQSTILASTLNDGTQLATIKTIRLNAAYQTQSWKGISNTDGKPKIDSLPFIVTAMFEKYWGPVSNLPWSNSNGVDNRIYANGLNKSFQEQGENTITLSTGTSQKTFVAILPPNRLITSVIDTTNLGLDITRDYILQTITIKDAGGTDRAYNMYVMSLDEPYTTSANHVIKTN